MTIYKTARVISQSLSDIPKKTRDETATAGAVFAISIVEEIRNALTSEHVLIIIVFISVSLAIQGMSNEQPFSRNYRQVRQDCL